MEGFCTVAKHKKQQQLFMRRSFNIYRHAKERNGGELSFTLAELRASVLLAFVVGCPYCKGPITAKSFSIDRRTPGCRGGTYARWNTVICCVACNGRKGALLAKEYEALLKLLSTFGPEAKKDVLARLRFGAMRMTRFRHAKTA